MVWQLIGLMQYLLKNRAKSIVNFLPTAVEVENIDNVDPAYLLARLTPLKLQAHDWHYIPSQLFAPRTKPTP